MTHTHANIEVRGQLIQKSQLKQIDTTDCSSLAANVVVIKLGRYTLSLSIK